MAICCTSNFPDTVLQLCTSLYDCLCFILLSIYSSSNVIILLLLLYITRLYYIIQITMLLCYVWTVDRLLLGTKGLVIHIYVFFCWTCCIVRNYNYSLEKNYRAVTASTWLYGHGHGHGQMVFLFPFWAMHCRIHSTLRDTETVT